MSLALKLSSLVGLGAPLPRSGKTQWVPLTNAPYGLRTPSPISPRVVFLEGTGGGVPALSALPASGTGEAHLRALG